MRTYIKMIIAAASITAILIAGTAIYYKYFAKRRLIVSTTTSLYDTGLLNYIEEKFEGKYPIDVIFIALGTGAAIENAKRGDADLILVHSPKLEKSFLEEGYGVSRKIIAYNFFIIVGPESDPAGIKGLNATEALKKIAAYGENHPTEKIWVSRYDNSGTHNKEQSLWEAAGFNYPEISDETKTWYVRAYAGMGKTLLTAEEFSAYTLADVGTYLKYFKDGSITLTGLISESRDLLNVYSAIAVNQTKCPNVNFEDAITFIKFLISDEGQQLIENYGKEEYGRSLLYGAVQPLTQNSQPIASWIMDYAFIKDGINNYECPPKYRDSRHPELYSEGA
ncbi:MAG: substrate-binding domain-containing protein [Candidatus Bathyarchaeia archaeon]